MRFLYIFLRTFFKSRLTLSESWSEAGGYVEYERKNPEHQPVMPWENPNDMPSNQVYEGPKDGEIPVVCKKHDWPEDYPRKSFFTFIKK